MSMKPTLSFMMVVMAMTAWWTLMAAAQNVTVTTAPVNATIVVQASPSASPSASPTRTPAAVVVVVSVAPSPSAGVVKEVSVTVQNTSPASALGSAWLKLIMLADFGLGSFFFL